MRCFIALELPGAARAELARVAEDLRPLWPRLSWSRPEGYHLTLSFLGEIEGQGIAAAERALSSLAGTEAIAFRFGGLDRFPPKGEVRVLVVRIEDGGASARLAAALEAALEAAQEAALTAARGAARGAAPRFSPHITLARVGPRAGKPDLGRETLVEARPAIGGAYTINRCALYKSELRPAGAVYTELAGIPLTEGLKRETDWRA